MSCTGFPSGSGLDEPAAWAAPVQPGVPDTRLVAVGDAMLTMRQDWTPPAADPTDTQMLDWLLTNRASIERFGRHVFCRYWGVEEACGPLAMTPRAAIAAAMKEHP
jgi:hypothetical protein